MLESIPEHLKDFIVNQNYDEYTAIDHTVWKYVLSQNLRNVKNKSYPDYLGNLKKLKINIDEIPRIENISKQLSYGGWKAVPVNGLIPSSIFMEFHAHGYLPIAVNIRSLDQIAYTPAPDILHEAAGHAPLLLDDKFSEFLKIIGDIGSKVFSNKLDKQVFEATRILSILKENAHSSFKDIEQAENNLASLKSISNNESEETLISRLFWWTVEYGLIGNLNDPKIFGAALLSSVDESNAVFNKDVDKVPFSLEGCLSTPYDITSQQPQLFVIESFDELIDAIKDFEKETAYYTGGTTGLRKALLSNDVSTIVYSSGLQVTGTLENLISEDEEIVYFSTVGKTFLSFGNNQIIKDDLGYYKKGFGSPIGKLKSEVVPIEYFSEEKLLEWRIIPGKSVTLEFESKIIIEGEVTNVIKEEGRIILIKFKDCIVRFKGKVIFHTKSGYNLAVGEKITSCFAGFADKKNFKGNKGTSYKSSKIISNLNIEEIQLSKIYQDIRSMRKSLLPKDYLETKLAKIIQTLDTKFPNDWLLRLEVLEIIINEKMLVNKEQHLLDQLEQLKRNESRSEVIEKGISVVYS